MLNIWRDNSGGGAYGEAERTGQLTRKERWYSGDGGGITQRLTPAADAVLPRGEERTLSIGLSRSRHKSGVTCGKSLWMLWSNRYNPPLPTR